MEETLIAVFDNQDDVEEAIDMLQSEGFDPKDISIVMKNTDEAVNIRRHTGADVAGSAAGGLATGAVIGGIAGLLAGTIIPGLGAVLIGGPIALSLGLTGVAATTAEGVVTGAVAGGLIGALTHLGLTREEAEDYQAKVDSGAILIAVPADESDETFVSDVFRDNHATDMRILRQESREYSRPDADTMPESGPHFATLGMKGGKVRHSADRKRKTDKRE